MVISLEDYEKLRLLLESGKATPKDIEVWGNIKEAVDGMFEYFEATKPSNFKEQRDLIASDFPAITNIFDVVFLPSLVRQGNSIFEQFYNLIFTPFGAMLMWHSR